MAEPYAVNKPGKSFPRALAEVVHRTLKDAFAKQGFAATEIVTRWPDIVGPEIAAHTEPEKVQWPRPRDGKTPEPGILVLRVEGPTALEIQHLSAVILERVNRFFGWRAVADLRLRQAPLRRKRRPASASVDPEAVARIAADLGRISDANLRDALARLGAAIKQS